MIITTYERETIIMSYFQDIETKKKRNWFILGIASGVIIATSALSAYDAIKAPDKAYVCQKGKLFKQMTIGGSVYKKTVDQCLDKPQKPTEK